jgi:hypothetical protein
MRKGLVSRLLSSALLSSALLSSASALLSSALLLLLFFRLHAGLLRLHRDLLPVQVDTRYPAEAARNGTWSLLRPIYGRHPYEAPSLLLVRLTHSRSGGAAKSGLST